MIRGAASRVPCAMASNEYVFQTRWRIPGTTLDEISTVLLDAPALARWWPSVYLEVAVKEPGDPVT